jgi:hypothetical protein
MHELVHAATSNYMDANPDAPATKQVNRLHKLALTAAFERGADFYGLEDPHEFLAEAMTNEDFQRFLASVETPDGNLFSEFLDALLEMLGLSKKDRTLLAQAVQSFEDISWRQGEYVKARQRAA